MPVHSLTSPVRTWPDRRVVHRAARQWALQQHDDSIRRIGYFGSYARGDWGVGSDLDLVVVVEQAEASFERRGVRFDATALPVPADVLVYTEKEWAKLSSPFARRMKKEMVWI